MQCVCSWRSVRSLKLEVTFLTLAGGQVWCLGNNDTFVALKLAWGEARGRECIRSDTRPTEQTKPQANFSATRRAACLLGGGVVARSSQIHFGICSSLAPSLHPKSIAANV